MTQPKITPNQPDLTLTPLLRFPEFRGQPGWKRNELHKIAEPVSERADRNDENNILTLSGEHGLLLQSEYFGKQIAGTSSDRYLKIHRDDFVYNDRTTKASEYGTIKRLSKHAQGIVSPIYKCFRFNNGEIPAFWEWYFESGSHALQLRSLANEGARSGRFNVSIDRFLSTAAYAPASESGEQQKIAECLGTLDELIGAESQKLDVLKGYKNGLMQQLFPRESETLPRLRFPGFQSAKEWSRRPFGEFVSKSFYGTSSPTSSTGRFPVLRMGNMVDGGLDLTNLVYIDLDLESFERFRLEDGDILLNRTNSPDLVGKVSLFRAGPEYLAASYIVTYRLDKRQINPLFCNFLLNSPLMQTKIKLLAKPSISQANINPTTFRNELIVAVPEVAEQNKIASCLSSLDDLIAAQAGQLDVLKYHKKGLMQQLFPSLQQAVD